MHDLFKPLIDWYSHSLESGGYPLIVLLMFIESTFLPLPSELIIPPAAYLAYTKGTMSIPGIVLAGALGSWLGATAMYWTTRWAGRPLVLKFGKYFLISPAKVEKAERWAAAYGNFGIFASRLLPVVRHLIGIPAGIVRMNYFKFSLWTVVGSGLWCAVLCWLGIKAGQDTALMNGELHSITYWVFGILAVLATVYWFFVHRHMQAERK
ncbi:MAG: Membrane protein DedA, SNARE-associated domain [Lacunisphaera sp.]|nr:Membrane protein DedA, SNARE-associated domain [Lacunisphaera sp.]